MKKIEKELFFELCKFKSPDRFKIQALINVGAATPTVLGHIFFNRMAGVAYGTLEKADLLGSVNLEFRNSLKGAYLQNVERNKSFFNCLKAVESILQAYKGKYALLKGAYLCHAYPEGYRTSNDIDILVRPSDVTKIGQALTEAGFKQGCIRNEKFIPATRSEIILSKMMRGETVPYIKEVNSPYMKYLKVDINFSVDYKNGRDDIVSEILDGSKTVSMGDFSITLPNSEDFFVHLCHHLFKEATTYPLVKKMRDLTLYKFCDIYMLLSEMSKDGVERIANRAAELRVLDAFFYAVYMTGQFFSVDYPIIRKMSLFDRSVLHKVVSPSDKKVYMYSSEDIKSRFFCDNRIKLLKEVKTHEAQKIIFI